MTTDVMIKSLIFHDIFVVMQQFSNILILIDGWWICGWDLLITLS